MSKRNKKKKEVIGTISYVELVSNSSHKLGRHISIVSSGTGAHKSKKDYNRKNKKSAIRDILKDYKDG